jgi:DNA anti-recombination protein RmuC
MPFVEIGLVIMSLVALFVAWRAWRELRALNGKMQRLSETLYQTRQEQRQKDDEIQQRVAALDVALQQATGQMRFDPQQSLAELFEREPRAQNVLAAFHIGGCASCAVDEHATLAEAVRARGANLDNVLTALNALPANGGAPNVRAPNVKFEM